MSHTIREKKKLLARVGRIRGQIEAIERALTEEAGCDRIMHMIAGVRGGVAGLMAEVVEDHIRTHLVDPEKNPGALNADAADQLIEVVHTYLKEGTAHVKLSQRSGGGFSQPCLPGRRPREERAQDLGGDLALRHHD